MKLRSALFASAAALAVAGGGFAALAATEASAAPAPPTVIKAVSVQTSAHKIAPHVEVFTFDNITPQVAAPGYAITSTIRATCLVNVAPLTRCAFTLTTTGPRPHKDLEGTATVGPRGNGAGLIRSGSGAWRGARGTVTIVALGSTESVDTFTFRLPPV